MQKDLLHHWQTTRGSVLCSNLVPITSCAQRFVCLIFSLFFYFKKLCKWWMHSTLWLLVTHVALLLYFLSQKSIKLTDDFLFWFLDQINYCTVSDIQDSKTYIQYKIATFTASKIHRMVLHYTKELDHCTRFTAVISGGQYWCFHWHHMSLQRRHSVDYE